MKSSFCFFMFFLVKFSFQYLGTFGSVYDNYDCLVYELLQHQI